MQPQAPPQVPQGSRMNTGPLLASTIIYLCIGLLILPAIGMIFMNDSNNKEAYVVGWAILAAWVISMVVQITIVCRSTRRYLRTNSLAKTAFIFHLVLGGTLLLIGLLVIAYALVATTYEPGYTSSGVSRSQSVLMLPIMALMGIFGALILPITSLACLATAFSLTAKPPTLIAPQTAPPAQATSQPTP